MRKIFAFHLLNDLSGSPKVLRMLIKGWVEHGLDISVHTSNHDKGFLSNMNKVKYYDNKYVFLKSIPLRLFWLIWTQLRLIFNMYSKIGKHDIVYINTILPFGAAILGKIKGARVIYHIHETSINPQLFKKFLFFWIKLCATEVIYVSEFLANQEPLNLPSRVIWNAIEDDFVEKALAFKKPNLSIENILMVASLKKYKGIDEYVHIASKCLRMNFDLVVNANKDEISQYFSNITLPSNLKVYPAQDDIHPFYQRADIVMNLSRPDEWKETFGLTALEAMIYGLPVIVPPEGGIAEIVIEKHTGYHINGKSTDMILSRLYYLQKDSVKYTEMRASSIAHALKFSELEFISNSLSVLAK